MQNKEEITINDLVKELMESGSLKIDPWEELIIFPIANHSQILIRGINDSIKARNYVCAVSLLRSLIESTMVLVYDTSITKENETEYYKKFLENNRLQRWSKSKKKWENVRDEHLIKQFELATRLNIKNIYYSACDVLHFSLQHSKFLFKKDSRGVTCEIGEAGPEIPKKEYDKIIKLISDLTFIIKTQIAAAIHQKRLRNDEPESQVADKILNGRKVLEVK